MTPELTPYQTPYMTPFYTPYITPFITPIETPQPTPVYDGAILDFTVYGEGSIRTNSWEFTIDDFIFNSDGISIWLTSDQEFKGCSYGGTSCKTFQSNTKYLVMCDYSDSLVFGPGGVNNRIIVYGSSSSLPSLVFSQRTTLKISVEGSFSINNDISYPQVIQKNNKYSVLIKRDTTFIANNGYTKIGNNCYKLDNLPISVDISARKFTTDNIDFKLTNFTGDSKCR